MYKTKFKKHLKQSLVNLVALVTDFDLAIYFFGYFNSNVILSLRIVEDAFYYQATAMIQCII